MTLNFDQKKLLGSFAGVPVGSVTFKLTPSLSYAAIVKDRSDGQAGDGTVGRGITLTLTANHEFSVHP